ncbi:hypothetical protein [Salinilacihabitans rarus]|uniref:hypothetical protein n=1 Tax=Salinilacihabitans rarus TaxID=2961596 RepID=UPI0020C93771|nr:hypothetical protein [Salinilacihabitans rarus]
MLRLLFGVFLVLHGVVHVWYVVLSQGWIEVEEGMGWNGHSWLLSSLLPEGTILSLASVLYVVVTLGFVLGGLGYVLRQGWWGPAVAGAALLSTVVLVAMWDGRFDLLVEKGVVGVLINAVLLASVLSLE